MYHSRYWQSILMIVSIGPYYRALDVDTRLELFFFATHHVVSDKCNIYGIFKDFR